jgi:hypothetical protein
MRKIYFSNLHLCLRCSITLWSGGNESNNIFKLQKKIHQIISGVSIRTSCIQIFKDMLTLFIIHTRSNKSQKTNKQTKKNKLRGL